MLINCCNGRFDMRVGNIAVILAVLCITLCPNITSCQTVDDQLAAGGHGITWIEVEGGTFRMGSGNSAHQVTLKGFQITATEVTFDQYDAFCEATERPKPDDNGWGRGSRPVVNVSWNDIAQYCRWLSKEKDSEIRLPNEAEWEFAARGGQKSKGYLYSGSNDDDEVSWNEGNSGGTTQPVGTKKPNELGIYDMSGNVWEWCADWDDNSPDTPQPDSTKPAGGIKRAARGNSYDNPAGTDDLFLSVRATVDFGHPNAGFRIVKAK